MNGLAEKMKSAGVDTIGARLTAVCVEAIRRHPDSPSDAWHYVGSVFGHEFVRGLMGDMRGSCIGGSRLDALIEGIAPKNRHTKVGLAAANKPYEPRLIPQERIEKRRELEQIVRSKYKNSSGVSWSEVSWHELVALGRDGKEAAALLAACSSDVPNDGRTVGDVLGVKQTDAIIAAVRG